MEIKFRAWHKEHKRYYDLLQILLDLETVLLNDLLNAFECDLDEVIIEQYTGLEDKNDKETYVGDIVSNIGEVFSIDDIRGLNYDDDTVVFEVIGNIHENGDML